MNKMYPPAVKRFAQSSSTLAVIVAVALLVVAPAIGGGFFVNFVLTRTLILGIAAASLIFLSSYSGMVSLSQYLIAGIAAFMVGNAVTTQGSNGLRLGWNPWLGVLFGIIVATAVSAVLGAIASRAFGIYFLMLTMTFSVIGYYFFGQVTTFSGFGGISGVNAPPFFDKHPGRIYFAALVVSVAVYTGLRYLVRTPFGLALQGTRDDPQRMRALGFNVALHRTVAFAVAGFVASLSGVLYLWWNAQIDPTSIAIGPTLTLLIIAVIGGISHLEGAWLGAFTVVMANNYIQLIPFVDKIGITSSRFNTLIGILVIAIMVLSPEGVVGLFQRLTNITHKKGSIS